MIDWRPECTKQSWDTDAGAFTSGPTKIVLHTTETLGFPGYYSDAGVPGMKAPHETWKWNPVTKKFNMRQHVPHTLASRALKNADGGVETNRDGAHQVELVMYCDKIAARSVGGLWVGDVDDTFLKELGSQVRKLANDVECKPVLTQHIWIEFVRGADKGQRMSNAEWDGFAGICGHEHVPENNHQDPGNLNVARAMSLSAPQPLPEDTMEPRDVSTDLLAWSTVPVGDLDPTDGKWSLRTAISDLVTNVHTLRADVDALTKKLDTLPSSTTDAVAIAEELAKRLQA